MNTVIVDVRVVCCSGDEMSKHPAVYLELKDGCVTCIYCGKKYLAKGKNENDN